MQNGIAIQGPSKVVWLRRDQLASTMAMFRRAMSRQR
jgi:hypothetical protein